MIPTVGLFWYTDYTSWPEPHWFGDSPFGIYWLNFSWFGESSAGGN